MYIASQLRDVTHELSFSGTIVSELIEMHLAETIEDTNT